MARKLKKYAPEDDGDENGVKTGTSIARGVGDNSGDKPIEGKKLMGYIAGLEKLNAKKDQVLQEIRETYADAKGIGYDNKTIRQIVKERKMEPEKRKEQADLLALYKSAIGMLDDE